MKVGDLEWWLKYGAELQRLDREQQRCVEEYRAAERELKRRLVAGATVEPGAAMCWIELLPGRPEGSTDPDDYLLHFPRVPARPQ